MTVCSLASHLFGSRFYLCHLSTCPRVSAESYSPLDFTGSSQLIEFTALFRVNYGLLGCLLLNLFVVDFTFFSLVINLG